MSATATAASLAPKAASLRSTKAISSSRAALLAKPKSVKRGARVAAQAALYFPGDQEYISMIAAEYPDKGIANWEEGRCLFSELGYSILDIRAECELDQVGNYPRELPSDHNFNGGGSIVHIPIIFAQSRYSSEEGKKVMINMEPNRDFINAVTRAFPDKENAKIIVSCSDGRDRAIQALEALDEAGYYNIVGLRGGYNMWNRTWDAKMRRRNLPGDFKEEYQHGADGCGVHATGATFQNQDAFQYADWKDDTEWIQWSA